MTKTPNTATIDMLRPGSEYPDGNINARLTYTEAEINELAASLLPTQDGQLRPFLVATHPKKPGVFFVFGGGRRRIAYERLIADGKLPKDHAIEIKDHGHITVAEALSKSLADNQAVPMHPADQAQTFAELAADYDPRDIAEERGMTLRAVKQSIAYGRDLSAEALEAWRSGEISAEHIKLFTVADKEVQVAVLERMRETYRGREWSEKYGVDQKLNRALRGNEGDAARYLKFVGEEAYIAAGGRIAKDLFDDKKEEISVVQDLPLLKKLARKKLQAKADKLTEEGWSWVDVQLSAHFSEWNYGKSQDKKKDGCVVRIAGTKIEVKSGLTKKKDEPQAARTPTASENTNRPLLGHNGWIAIKDTRSLAVSAMLTQDRHSALAALLASFAVHRTYGSPLAIEFMQSPASDSLKITHQKKWADAFADFRKLPEADLTKVLAQCAAAFVDLQNDPGKDPDDEALLRSMDQSVLQEWLAKLFRERQAKDYFGAGNDKFLLACIEDALGADEKRRQEKKGKSALANFCVDSVVSTGWLPKDLRTSAYDGPGEKADAKAKKPAKSAAPKKKAA